MSDAQQRNFARIACALGAIAVVTGAFGAHGLKTRVDAEGLAVWQTAVSYQMYHALALLALAAGATGLRVGTSGVWAARAWLAGIAIFSGSLYVLVLTGVKWLGAITPIGGVAFIAGWILAAISIGKPGDTKNPGQS